MIPTINGNELTMQIHVNNEPLNVEAGLSLTALLTQLDQLTPGVALAINQKIVSRSQWDQHILQDGDCITLVKATAGG